MYTRHDLIYLDESGRQYAFANSRPNRKGIDNTIAEKFIYGDGPAIVRRQETTDPDMLDVGFSTTVIVEDGRVRFSVTVPKASIIRHIRPFDILDNCCCLPRRDLIKDIEALSKAYGLDFGLYGTAAMQAMTNLPYMNENSDIDVYFKFAGSKVDLRGFAKELFKLEDKHKIPIDAELEVENGDVFGIKIKELMNAQKTVLAKGFNGVEIFYKNQLFEGLLCLD